MDLRRKLARLGAPLAAPRAAQGVAPTPLPAASSPYVAAPHDPGPVDAWPFTEVAGPEGVGLVAEAVYPLAHRHGLVPVGSALDADGATLVALGLDRALATVSPRDLLFLDTETTGLAGGAGTMPFLLGGARFTDAGLVVTQHLVPAPGEEGPALAWLDEALHHAAAVVTFNGKSFDLPLLKSRVVLARRPGLAPRPHLDLLHAARRVFSTRLPRCTLGAVERAVLDFLRHGDVAGQDIPARYLRYLRLGDRAALAPVVTHNRWDLLALPSLLGELAARFGRRPGAGRHQPEDALGVARTLLKGGDASAALRHADALGAHPEAPAEVRAAALMVGAEVQRRRRDRQGTAERLIAALAQDGDNPAAHLQLAVLYERTLHDPERALHHARRATGAEAPESLARRVHRLERRCRAGIQLALPGLQRPEGHSPRNR